MHCFFMAHSVFLPTSLLTFFDKHIIKMFRMNFLQINLHLLKWNVGTFITSKLFSPRTRVFLEYQMKVIIPYIIIPHSKRSKEYNFNVCDLHVTYLYVAENNSMQFDNYIALHALFVSYINLLVSKSNKNVVYAEKWTQIAFCNAKLRQIDLFF